MLNADGLRRQLLIVRARDLHSGAERRHLRGRAVRRLHRLYYGDLSERSAAAFSTTCADALAKPASRQASAAKTVSVMRSLPAREPLVIAPSDQI